MKSVEELATRLKNLEQLVDVMEKNIRTLVESKESREPLSYRCTPVEPMDIILFGSNGFLTYAKEQLEDTKKRGKQ